MRAREIWIFLFAAGVLAFNWPFLAIFKKNLPVYLFASWLILIALIYVFVGRTAKDDDGG
jgi:hypothetical protein